MFDGIFESVAPLAAEAAGISMGLPPGTMSMVGSAIGGVGSYMGQQSANQANAALSQKQMDFQDRMRSTSYQTAVEDLKKAGLNPMLAYQQGGAGNQVGASAQMQNAIGEGVKSTAEHLSKYQELRNQNVQERLINSQIDVADADAVLKRATAITEAYRPGLTQAQTNNILKQAGLFTAQTHLASAQEAKTKQDFNIKMPEEAMSKTYYGQIRPYVQDAMTGIGQALDFLPKKKSSINIYPKSK
jgi:hypothetical protein